MLLVTLFLSTSLSFTAARPILPVLPLNITSLILNAHSNYSDLFIPLLSLASTFLSSPLHSVTLSHPPLLPPNSNPSFYFSFDPFWWPSPTCDLTSPTHTLTCHYYQRSVVNHGDVSTASSPAALANVTLDALLLTLSSVLINSSTQATRAAAHLYTFFLDPTLAMQPSVIYARARVGNNSRPITARPEGVMDLRELPLLLQAESLLDAYFTSSVWPPSHHLAFTQWTSALLTHLTSSVQGVTAASSPTHLSTWWTCEVLALQYHLHLLPSADVTLTSYLSSHYDAQFNGSGYQPFEQSTPTPWDDQLSNAEGLDCIASYAQLLGRDVYHSPNAHNATLLTIASALLSSLPSPDAGPALLPLLTHLQAVYPEGGWGCWVGGALNASTALPLLVPLTSTWPGGVPTACADTEGGSAEWGLWVQVTVVGSLLLISLIALALCVWKTKAEEEGEGGETKVEGEEQHDEEEEEEYEEEEEEEEEEEDEDEDEDEDEETVDDGLRLTHSRDSSMMIAAANGDDLRESLMLSDGEVDDAARAQQKGRPSRRHTTRSSGTLGAPTV